MRKALLPLLASLLICGTATVALIAGNARAAQTSHRPVMMLAQNQSPPAEGPETGAPGIGPHLGEICQDLYAHKAAELAFLEAKLNLAASQQPLFSRWKDVSMDMAKRHQSDCNGRLERMHNSRRPDMMERLAREEDMLRRRITDIEAERPALGALYAALNPAQKQEFARGAMGRRMDVAMGMMRHGPQVGGRFGRGPDGAPPLPPPPLPQ